MCWYKGSEGEREARLSSRYIYANRRVEKQYPYLVEGKSYEPKYT